MAESYAALLRRAANDIEYARDSGHSTIPADEAAQLGALADLLERVTPEMVDIVEEAAAGVRLLSQDTDPIVATLHALAAGPAREGVPERPVGPPNRRIVEGVQPEAPHAD